MKTTLPVILAVGLFTACTIPTYAQTDEEIYEMLEGKWKLEVMRDSTGNAIELPHAGDPESEPEVYATIDIKGKKRAVLSAWNATINTKWELNGKLLNFYLKKKDIWVTFPVRSINSNMMVLIFTVAGEDRPMKIEVYYKKV